MNGSVKKLILHTELRDFVLEDIWTSTLEKLPVPYLMSMTSRFGFFNMSARALYYHVLA